MLLRLSTGPLPPLFDLDDFEAVGEAFPLANATSTITKVTNNKYFIILGQQMQSKVCSLTVIKSRFFKFASHLK